MKFPALLAMSDIELVILLKATNEALVLRNSSSDKHFREEILRELKDRELMKTLRWE